MLSTAGCVSLGIVRREFAPLAEEQLTHVLQSSFCATTLAQGDLADRGWPMLYANPPYAQGGRQVYRLIGTMVARAGGGR